MSRPVLTHSTPGGEPVCGVTVLKNIVFIVRHSKPEVEAYDASMLTIHRRLPVKDLEWAWDMASSAKQRCLYVADVGQEANDGFYRVHRS